MLQAWLRINMADPLFNKPVDAASRTFVRGPDGRPIGSQNNSVGIMSAGTNAPSPVPPVGFIYDTNGRLVPASSVPNAIVTVPTPEVSTPTDFTVNIPTPSLDTGSSIPSATGNPQGFFSGGDQGTGAQDGFGNDVSVANVSAGNPSISTGLDPMSVDMGLFSVDLNPFSEISMVDLMSQVAPGPVGGLMSMVSNGMLGTFGVIGPVAPAVGTPEFAATVAAEDVANLAEHAVNPNVSKGFEAPNVENMSQAQAAAANSLAAAELNDLDAFGGLGISVGTSPTSTDVSDPSSPSVGPGADNDSETSAAASQSDAQAAENDAQGGMGDGPSGPGGSGTSSGSDSDNDTEGAPGPGGGEGGTGGNSSGSGECFITTAVVDHKGLPDNCHALETLRDYRDNYLLSFKSGTDLVREYYTIGPKIVDGINKAPEKDNILNILYKEYILPCVDYIEEGRYEKAKEHYINMVLYLCRIL